MTGLFLWLAIHSTIIGSQCVGAEKRAWWLYCLHIRQKSSICKLLVYTSVSDDAIKSARISSGMVWVTLSPSSGNFLNTSNSKLSSCLQFCWGFGKSFVFRCYFLTTDQSLCCTGQKSEMGGPTIIVMTVCHQSVIHVEMQIFRACTSSSNHQTLSFPPHIHWEAGYEVSAYIVLCTSLSLLVLLVFWWIAKQWILTLTS